MNAQKTCKHFLLLFALAFLSSFSFGQNYEVSCPLGSSPLYPIGVTFDGVTGNYRAWLCVDFSGNIIQNGVAPTTYTNPSFPTVSTNISIDGLGRGIWQLTDSTKSPALRARILLDNPAGSGAMSFNAATTGATSPIQVNNTAFLAGGGLASGITCPSAGGSSLYGLYVNGVPGGVIRLDGNATGSLFLAPTANAGSSPCIVFPPISGNVSLSLDEDCGSTTACAKTALTPGITVHGTVALSSGTPSTAVLTALPFTSTSSYVCTATEATNAANNLLKVVNTSATSATITGPNTITDTINYICHGS